MFLASSSSLCQDLGSPEVFMIGCLSSRLQYFKQNYWDFPGSLVVKTSLSHTGVRCSISGGALRSHMPHGQKTKASNRSSVVTFSRLLKWCSSKKFKNKQNCYVLVAKRLKRENALSYFSL